MTKWILDVHGNSLNIESKIYDDLRGVGSKEQIRRDILSGVYIGILTSEEEEELAKIAGISVDEWQELMQARKK
jgi:hypothetical protein